MVKALMIRRTRDGNVKVRGDFPDEQTFPFSWLQREIASGMVEITVTVNHEDGPTVYAFEGFEPHVDADGRPERDKNGDPKLNFTAWKCRKVEG
ncbi:hypothetical protein [Microbispora sp. KK1-11]|uniref:hypothetical protein n=1 Tax=Microbispora sp. KK1-11 TaxID=2053005 RepID=UPI00115B07B5|nr:hypothetical protein [Microbispora sp. KK1-11]TQS30042.1 hypothetical protein FLW16_06690 [Microbispora sp. KK1-11]